MWDVDGGADGARPPAEGHSLPRRSSL